VTLKRTPMPPRRARLVAKTPLARTGWAALDRKPAKPARRRDTGPQRGVVDAVYERAQHCCELCTLAVGPVRGTDHHLHHRRPRRAGGSSDPATNWPSNILLLCPGCHETVESHRTAAYEAGWLVRAGDDPAAVPVLIWRGTRGVLLTPDGEYAATEGVAA
jgi:5-methylcytosine-specific restriction protein A